MPSNYPMTTSSGSVATVTLMFTPTPSKASTIVWNSVVEPGYGAPPGPVSAAESVIPSRMMAIQALTVILAAFLAGRM